MARPRRQDYPELRRAARALVGAGFRALRQRQLLPLARKALPIYVGRDYEGALLRNSPEMAPFEAALHAAFPERFTGTETMREFAEQYAFALLQGCTLMIARARGQFRSSAPQVTVCIDEMLDLLTAPGEDAVVARLVSDVIVTHPIRIGNVQVLPVDHWSAESAMRIIDQIMPGTLRELHDRLDPFWIDPDSAIMVAHAHGNRDAANPLRAGFFAAASAASAQIDALLATIRIATACTAQNLVEAMAPPGFVKLHRLSTTLFNYQPWPIVKRVAELEDAHVPALLELNQLLSSWSKGVSAEPTTIGVAIDRYARSFGSAVWYDQIVELSVSLEATLLGGQDKDEISLRLRTRAAHLLATDGDPPASLYGDIKVLYNLRSGVVHGSSLTRKKIEKDLKKVSISSRSRKAGEQSALCLDRLRDIARRAILARGCLADAGSWPLTGEGIDVDGLLVDEASKTEWRQTLQKRLADIGLATTLLAASPAELDFGVNRRDARQREQHQEPGRAVNPST